MDRFRTRQALHTQGCFKATNPRLRAESYETVCHVIVDPTTIPCLSFISPAGTTCFVQAYEVVYTYGQTELKAQLRWMEGVREDFVLFYCSIILMISAQDEEKRYFY